MKKNVLLLVSLVTLALSPMAVHADAYIDHQMATRIVPGLSNEGYVIQDTVETNLLNDGEYQTFTITPPYGAEVILVAVGDWDANDVDMFVHGGESGRTVARDVLDDDMPVCRFVSMGGSYRVTIKVADTDLPARVKLIYGIR